MINDTTRGDEDLLSAWVIHFSLAGCTTSVLREKLKNPSNIHLCKSITFDESTQFDLIYFLTQMFLSGDIETLERIILEPEEIHEFVQQMASLRRTLNESGDFNEANYRTEIDKQPFIRCNFIEEKCGFFELLVTDTFDPNHNLRGLLRDLQDSFNSRNETRGIQVRDSSCVTSHNATKCTKDKDTQTPSSQRSKQTQTNGSSNWDPTIAGEDALTPLSSSKSKIKCTEKNPQKITPKISRKRRINSSGRKSFHGEVPKMRRIETYFKPKPKKTHSKCSSIEDKKGNGRSSSNDLEIHTVEDDSDSSVELMENVLHRDHMGTERHNSVLDKLYSFETECFQEDDNLLTEKTRTSVTTPIQGEACDRGNCVSKENLPDFTFGTQHNGIETCDTETAANRYISNSAIDTDLHRYDKNMFHLDATAREIIRDWCGGDTFLTQDSSESSEETTKCEYKTTDKDNGINDHHNWNNNDKIDDDDDDENDNNDNNGVMNEDLDHSGHDANKSDTDDDSDNDDIESDDVNDEDYVYDSEDESDSESD